METSRWHTETVARLICKPTVHIILTASPIKLSHIETGKAGYFTGLAQPSLMNQNSRLSLARHRKWAG